MLTYIIVNKVDLPSNLLLAEFNVETLEFQRQSNVIDTQQFTQLIRY